MGFYPQIRDALKGVSKVGYGSFVVELQTVANLRGIPETANDLRGLSSDELQFFLVVGGESGNQTKYSSGLPQERQARIIDELSKRGLLQMIKMVDTSDPDYPKGFTGKATMYQTTDKGRKVHRAIMDVIYQQLARAK
jgi:hypothetical protein